MREGSRANALLMELLLVIFFFMIGAAILVQLFADARHKSIQARAASESLAEGQNCAEAIYALDGDDDPEQWLADYGFKRTDDGKWVLEREDYKLTVTAEAPEKTASGSIRTYNITAEGDGVELYTLPSTRYLPSKEVAP
jgi:hypothetical protein